LTGMHLALAFDVVVTLSVALLIYVALRSRVSDAAPAHEARQLRPVAN